MSGLLPRNPNPPFTNGGDATFSSITVGSLVVTGVASIANLLLSSINVINATISGIVTLTGTLPASTNATTTPLVKDTVTEEVSLAQHSYNQNLTTASSPSFVAVSANTLSPSTPGSITIASSSNGNINLNPNGTGLVTVAGGATEGSITVNHTSNAGIIINRTDGGGTANGYRCTQNGTYGAEYGYNASTNEAYVACNTGNVKLFAGANVLNSTPQGITFIPTTVSLPRFEIGDGTSSDIVLARAQSAGAYFSGSAVGDLALRHGNTANSVRIGVGSATAQVVVANALTTTTNPLLMNSPTFHPITVNNTSATSGNDILFQNTGVNIAGFGANQATNEVYAWAFANQPFKIGTNNTERLRIAAAGIATDNTATNILALQGTTLVTKNNVADTSTAQVLTNKTIDSASNTLTITNAPLAAANVNALINQDIRSTASPRFVALQLDNYVYSDFSSSPAIHQVFDFSSFPLNYEYVVRATINATSNTDVWTYSLAPDYAISITLEGTSFSSTAPGSGMYYVSNAYRQVSSAVTNLGAMYNDVLETGGSGFPGSLTITYTNTGTTLRINVANAAAYAIRFSATVRSVISPA